MYSHGNALKTNSKIASEIKSLSGRSVNRDVELSGRDKEHQRPPCRVCGWCGGLASVWVCVGVCVVMGVWVCVGVSVEGVCGHRCVCGRGFCWKEKNGTLQVFLSSSQ